MADSAGEEGPPPKKKKENGIFETYISTLNNNGSFSDIRLAIKRLFEDQSQALGALEIESCNASVGYGVPFSRAWCHTNVNKKQVYSLALFFKAGRDLLYKVFRDPNYVPEEEKSTQALVRLLSFLCDEGSKSFICQLEEMEDLLSNETRLSVALAEHLLKRLSPNPNYILDNHCKKTEDDGFCMCGCKTSVHYKYGNTSIGHHNVWHGNIDIIAGMEDLPVAVEGYGDPHSPGGKTPVEVKYYNKSEILLTERVRHQMLAQTIVFSFLQKKRHPDSKHFLIPCVGMTMQQIVFYFYDSQNDVLLQSRSMSFTFEGGKIDYTTVIALWLVLNYKQLGSGLPTCISKIPKSNFAHLAKDKLGIYNDRLSFGNVCGTRLPYSFNPTSDPTTEFVFPSDSKDFVL